MITGILRSYKNSCKCKLRLIGMLTFQVLFMTACSLKLPSNTPDTGAFNNMTTYSGDYCIDVNAINPGHPSGGSIFSTSFDWYDQENYKTDVHVNYYFYSHALSEDYNPEKEIIVDGKDCYYIPESATKVLILYEADDNAYLKVELTAINRFNMLTGDGVDMDIVLQDTLKSDEFKNAFGFKVTKTDEK